MVTDAQESIARLWRIGGNCRNLSEGRRPPLAGGAQAGMANLEPAYGAVWPQAGIRARDVAWVYLTPFTRT